MSLNSSPNNFITRNVGPANQTKKMGDSNNQTTNATETSSVEQTTQV